MKCQNCERDFKPNRDWQRFCDKQCQQAWNRFQGRRAEVMAAEERAVKANGHLNGSATDDANRANWEPEDRQQPRFLRRF
jgi:hypothetical protein